MFVGLERGLRVGPVTQAAGQFDGAFDGERGALPGAWRGCVYGITDEGHPPSGPARDGRHAPDGPGKGHRRGLGGGEDLCRWSLAGENLT